MRVYRLHIVVIVLDLKRGKAIVVQLLRRKVLHQGRVLATHARGEVSRDWWLHRQVTPVRKAIIAELVE